MQSTHNLKSAYLAAGLWRQGLSFADALARPVVRRVLIATANAAQLNAARRGQAAPQQRELNL